MLELKGVRKIYVTKAGETVALNGVNIKFADKGLVFITGKSGCGKTTLLNVIGGLDNIDSGEIIVDGKKFSEFSPSDYDSYRNTLVGFVFQEYNLLSEYTIAKNIDIANELQGKKTEQNQLKKMLDTVEMSKFASRMPNQLSGGQKQRVAIARALIKNPKIVLADEPTGALDSATGIQVMQLLKELSKDKLVIVVSHEMEFAEKYADRIIRIVDGQVVEDISLNEIEIKENIYESDLEMVVKSGADLSEEESKKLSKAIKEKKKVNVTEKISVRQKQKTGEVKQSEDYKPVAFIKSKMKFKSILGFGTKSIAVKPFRLAITILLSVIAFAVFGLFDSVASYNGQRAINDMLTSSAYSAVSVSARYNDQYYQNAKIKLTQSYINQLSDSTNYNFKGVYEIIDTEEFAFSGDRTNFNRQVILKDLNFSISELLGRAYYYRSISGLIEFDKSEIKGNKIAQKEYDYTILYGKYPELNLDQDGVQEVGISSYLAESILYWLNEKNRTEFGEKQVEDMEDLVGAKLKTVNDAKVFTISAIIDCGKIPEKFDKLKGPLEGVTEALVQDFETFINAGGYLLLFAPSGYVNYARQINNRKTTYVGNHLNIQYSGVIGNKEHFASSYFYEASEFDGTNTIMFNDVDEEKSTGVVPILAQDEALVDVANLKLIYEQEISAAQNYYNGQLILKQINLKMKDALNIELSNLERRVAVGEIIELIEEVQQTTNMPVEREKMLTINSSAQEQVFETRQIKVKGVYFNVNTDILVVENNANLNPLVLSEQGLEMFNISKEQGIYSRAIAGLKRNYFGAKTLSRRLISFEEEGFTISWYKNGLFNIIESNSAFIGEVARLFLYIALVVVGFSIFMLFNYISTSIISKRQTIGVLRALGTGSKSIFLMFLTESIIITIISGALASIVASVACIFVNNYILQIIEAGIRFALFGSRQVIIIMLASMLTGVLASLMPIIRIIKEKPVALIRKE